MTTLDREALAAADRADPLLGLRDRFLLPEGVVYLDGNSLGPLPRAVPERLDEAVREQWGRQLIAAWGAGWLELPRRVAGRIARLIGAAADEVAVADSTSVNLYKLLAAALASLPPERRVVLTTADEFPTDLYIATSAAERAGGRLRVVPRGDLEVALAEAGDRGSEVGILLLGHVRYVDGELLDMAEWTRRAHRVGALALWDLSHSVGAVEVDLTACGVDLAVGCGYKFLNGGPGAPAFLFVARRHQSGLISPLPGWLGAAEPFAFSSSYRSAAGVERFLCGTPPILSLVALDAALELWDGVETSAVRARSVALGEVLIAAAEAQPGWAASGLELITPRRAGRRGSQVSWRHRRAEELVVRLATGGIVADFRPPDVVRCGLGPLFLRRVELADAARELVAEAGRLAG